MSSGLIRSDKFESSVLTLGRVLRALICRPFSGILFTHTHAGTHSGLLYERRVRAGISKKSKCPGPTQGPSYEDEEYEVVSPCQST
ncbi:hypothetical protein E1B28_013552 [Marasmius oreades]|uniref:Uncharacterized protein n=1 Tax=Marasmius oreades TaxID=181124 RepID=A0A9P7RPS1_9AGAR|nr:uncharacterized protein E1B28_013552 [Marasmius oreades]KAG7087599.1 hypothetical protein E1B28_013552 [Marasmius oreades]